MDYVLEFLERKKARFWPLPGNKPQNLFGMWKVGRSLPQASGTNKDFEGAELNKAMPNQSFVKWLVSEPMLQLAGFGKLGGAAC
eukprot:scaffold183383_cov20-Tisochrysis_lutea.AAC.1